MPLFNGVFLGAWDRSLRLFDEAQWLVSLVTLQLCVGLCAEPAWNSVFISASLLFLKTEPLE